MTSIIDRRSLLGGGLVLAGASAGAWSLTTRDWETGHDLEAGYVRLRSDLDDGWWDRGSNTSDALPAIRSTDGTGGWNTGRANANTRPPSIANARGGSFWQAAQYVRFLANDRALGAAKGHLVIPASVRLMAQRRFWWTIYTDAERASDGSGDGTVNASDDGAWKLQAMKAIHQASHAPADLATLCAATIAILARYLDSFTPGHRQQVGEIVFSRFGCLYARPGQDPNGQGRASTYETGIMDAALYLADRGGSEARAFRTYAATVYDSFRATLQRPSGIYFQTLQLDPRGRFDSTPFLTPIDAAKAVPRQDYTGVTIGGTMGMAVVAAELFRQTGDDRYRRDVAHIASGIVAEYRQNGCILCDRDPWTAGVWAYDFVTRAMPLPGVDPTGDLARAIGATGRRILATRTPIYTHRDRSAYGYSAEWSGNRERSINETRSGAGDGLVTWAAACARANGGRGGGQASPDQIMTASSSGMMVQAAVHLARQAAT